MFWISIQYGAVFFYPGFMYLKPKRWKAKGVVFASCSLIFMLCWPWSLRYRGKSASPRRQNSSSPRWMLRPSPSHTGLLLPMNQHEQQGVWVLPRVIDCDYCCREPIVTQLLKWFKKKKKQSYSELLELSEIALRIEPGPILISSHSLFKRMKRHSSFLKKYIVCFFSVTFVY